MAVVSSCRKEAIRRKVAVQVTEGHHTTEAEGGSFVRPRTSFPLNDVLRMDHVAARRLACPYRAKRGCVVHLSPRLLLLRGHLRDVTRSAVMHLVVMLRLFAPICVRAKLFSRRTMDL